MNTHRTPAPRSATIADVLAAGREYPVRDVKVALNHSTASAHLRALYSFWVDAAAGFMALVDAGCSDARYDVREALAFADYYAPSAR